MRGALLAAFLLCATGCAAPPAPAPELSGPLPALEATYDVAIAVAGREYAGSWRLETGAPERIMDRDGVVRSAWRLGIHLESGPEREAGRSRTADVVVWLDATLHVVREDVLCGSGECITEPGLVDWDGQGSPPPFGLGWTRLAAAGSLRYQADGRPVSAHLVESGGLLRLEDGAPLGALVATDPDMRYRFDGAWLPAEMRLDLPALDYSLRAVRTRLDVGPPLPLPETWPMAPYAAELPGPPRPLFSGEGRQAFHMGFTFDDALAALYRHDGRAQAQVAGGCVLAFAAVWTDRFEATGLTVADLAGIDGDLVQFVLLVQDRPGHRTLWQWGYGPASGERAGEGRFLFAEPGQVDLDPEHDVVCAPQGPDRQTAQQALQDSWQLPTAFSGLPCGLVASRAILRTAGGGTVAGHTVLSAIHYTDVHDNHPYDAPRLGFQTARNLQAGAWSQAILRSLDLDALDAGAGVPRPLPPAARPPLAALDAPRYECVEPADGSTTPPPARTGPPGVLEPGLPWPAPAREAFDLGPLALFRLTAPGVTAGLIPSGPTGATPTP